MSLIIHDMLSEYDDSLYASDNTGVILPTKYEHKQVKAKKIHICYECHNKIIVNEVYHRIRGQWNGKWEMYKVCHVCHILRGALADRTKKQTAPFGHLSEWVEKSGFVMREEEL